MTLREGERVRIFTSSTAERSPFPSRGRTITRLKVGVTFPYRALGAIADLIHRKRSPFSYEEKALKRGKVGETSRSGECSPSLKPAGRSPSPPGIRMPATLWGGLEGFTPPHHYRRGQRLPTDSVHSPAPREAPGSGLR